MNTDLKKEKSILKKVFFKLMNNLVFGKNMKNVRKHIEVKIFTTESRRDHLEQINHLTTKFFTKKLHKFL